MKKNKQLIGMLLLWRRTFIGWTENLLLPIRLLLRVRSILPFRTFFLPFKYAHCCPKEIMKDMEEMQNRGNKPIFKVLIVEENEELRTILVDIFTPFYVVEQVSEAQEGFVQIASFHPDIILSNVSLPLISGIELCRQVKKEASISHIPVVLYSISPEDNELEGLKSGADDYFIKPFNVNILLARCWNLIKLRMAIQKQFMKAPQIDTHVSTPPSLDDEFMDKAMNIIEENLANSEFKISELAREMGVCRTVLFSKWKAITGQSPNDYIIGVRLDKAASLLKHNPELNITEISEKTGFNSVGYFSRVFKNRYKMTPSYYRHEDKSNEN